MPNFGLKFLCQVSKDFDQVVSNSMPLVYLTELAKCGFVIGPMSRLNLPDSLSSLRAIQRTWESPQPRTISHIELQLPDSDNLITAGWWTIPGAVVRVSYADDGQSCQLDVIRILDIIHRKSIPPHITITLGFDCSASYLDFERQVLFAVERCPGPDHGGRCRLN